MKVLPGPRLAEAGVRVDHLAEQDPSLHQGLGRLDYFETKWNDNGPKKDILSKNS